MPPSPRVALLDRLPTSWRGRVLRVLIRLYPPYLGAGVRITRLADDLSSVEVAMPLSPLNRNAVGVHFGGSLYSMCDPFFMLILMEHLGRDYVVWDREATIRFLKPARGTVRARFSIPLDDIASIRRQAEGGAAVTPRFTAEVVDDGGDVVARVDKVLHVRRANR